MKRIIVCCDGTSNTVYQSRTDSPPTNVSRITNYIRPSASDGTPQIVLYQPGVGSALGLSRLWKQAWGIGIGVNIMAAYHFICLNYEDDDEIIMIGYSRGALAVRCIVNLIVEMGILSRAGLAHLQPVFKYWWKDVIRQDLVEHEELKGIKESDWRPKPCSIKFVGLWDTVDSVGRAGIFGAGSTLGVTRGGIPTRVRDGATMGGVQNFFHALSLHERRYLFQPVIANVPNGNHMEQCWFSGYHGDVGGGRSDDVLAHLPLIWMMGNLWRFVDLDYTLFFNVEMNPLEERASSDIRRTGRWLLTVSDTMTTWWRPFGTAPRRPGTVQAMPAENETVHWSVFTLTSESRAQPINHNRIIEVLIEPCWAFQNAPINDMGEPPRRWPPRDANPPDRIIMETQKHGAEEVLIQWWSGVVLRAWQGTARAGDEGGLISPGLFMQLFQHLF